MPNKHQTTIRLYFSFAVSLVITVTLILVGLLTIALIELNIWVPPTALLMSSVLLTGVTLGALLSCLVGEGLISPIVQLTKASRQVAAGDFSIRLKEQSPVNDIQTMCNNFNTMVKELGSMETLRSDFVANVSHEFKTPINAIEGYATLLQDSTLTKTEQEECVEKILTNTNRLSTLVGNILLLSKIENQTISSQRTEFRLDEQIRQALVMLEPRWEAKEIDFDIEMETITFRGVESLMTQVWMNLLENAIKFSPKNSTITVTLQDDSDYAVVEIADCGCGMSEEVQKRIFEKFYQAKTSRKAQGNGLGLPLVQKILELHAGSIQVISAPDEGALFRVRLPKNDMPVPLKTNFRDNSFTEYNPIYKQVDEK